MTAANEMRLLLGWAAAASPWCWIAAMVLPVSFRFRRMRWWVSGLALLAAQCAAEWLRWPTARGALGLVVIAGSVQLLVQGWRERLRVRRAWHARFEERKPLRLAAPFEGRWRAVSSGPEIGRNHHLTARDQWFAVDWVRADGRSRGSRILSPVDGVVEHVEDGHRDKPARRWIQAEREYPAGNYVSIRAGSNRTGHGARASADDPVWVILAHLERGSISVAAGDVVRMGDAIGRCGNSGNTTIPHLHIHAQPRAQVQAGAVWGIPVVFGERTEAMRPGQVLVGVSAQKIGEA